MSDPCCHGQMDAPICGSPALEFSGRIGFMTCDQWLHLLIGRNSIKDYMRMTSVLVKAWVRDGGYRALKAARPKAVHEDCLRARITFMSVPRDWITRIANLVYPIPSR